MHVRKISQLARIGAPMLLLGALIASSGACGDGVMIPGPTGSLQVVTVTEGETPDPDGYVLAFDGVIQTTTIGANETVVVDLEVGVHDVKLIRLEANCQVAGENPRTVTVTEDATTSVRFEVACSYVLREIVFSGERHAYSCAGNLRDCGGIYVMSADGVSPKKLTDGADLHDDQPVWAPDGSKILFTRDDGQTRGIHVMNADGSGLRALTGGPADSEPAWSPDGGRIAFNRGGDIYVMGADGSALVNLTPRAPYASDPAWSPDGSRIVFSGDRVAGDCHGLLEACFDIRVMDADGGNLETVRTSGFHDYQPVWSPDGSKILFTREEELDLWWVTSSVYVMNADGTDTTDLTQGSGDTDPVWSPDGNRIAFTRRSVDGSEIFVINADGSEAVNLTQRRGNHRSPAWLSTAQGAEADR